MPPIGAGAGALGRFGVGGQGKAEALGIAGRARSEWYPGLQRRLRQQRGFSIPFSESARVLQELQLFFKAVVS